MVLSKGKTANTNSILFLLSIFLVVSPLSLMAHGVDPADQEVLNAGGIWAYIWVGAKHMVTGYDHLLFLAGVVFYLSLIHI